MCLQYILVRFSSSSLRTISTGFIFLFSYMNTNYIHYIHPHSPFASAYPFSLKKICFSLLPFIFFKCLLIVQGCFTLVLQACIYCALIKLLPPCYFLILYHNAPLIFNSLQYSTSYSHIEELFQYFSFSNLSLSPPSDKYNLVLSLTINIYIYIYTHT
jgi:hypothetical protein